MHVTLVGCDMNGYTLDLGEVKGVVYHTETDIYEVYIGGSAFIEFTPEEWARLKHIREEA